MEPVAGGRAGEPPRRLRALNEEVERAGELIVTEALADPSQTTRVSTAGGDVVTSDGPFAEAKELLAGAHFGRSCCSRG